MKQIIQLLIVVSAKSLIESIKKRKAKTADKIKYVKQVQFYDHWPVAESSKMHKQVKSSKATKQMGDGIRVNVDCSDDD